MSSLKPTTTINILPDNVFVEIFGLYRQDELDSATRSHRPWKWYRLAHVCRTWRYIMFASSQHLHLELLCTNRTPVEENIAHLPPFPIVISFHRYYFWGGTRNNLLAALEHRDRIRVIEVDMPRRYPLLEYLATAMQEPFPALAHFWFESEPDDAMPALPDSFLGGSAPGLQTIYISGIAFPAAPILISSARDLVEVNLSAIPPTGYIPPEAMVASLAALPKLEYLHLGFQSRTSYPDRMRLAPITRTVLPVLTSLDFDGLFEYFEDLAAQIDAPQLDCLKVKYLDKNRTANVQIPQLSRFIGRSEKLWSTSMRAELLIQHNAVVIKLVQRGRPSFLLSITGAIGQMANQISAILSNVDRLFISPEPPKEDDEPLGYGIPWLELFRPFTAVEVLSVDGKLSCHISHALKNVTGDRVAEVLPALELLFLGYKLQGSIKRFITARQNVGRPVTYVNREKEFQERLKVLDFGK